MKKATTILLLTLLASGLINAQDKAIDYKVLLSKIPTSVESFSAEGEPEGMNMDMNGMSWSSATREYTNGDKQLSVTVVDYHGAGDMYNGYAMAWSMDMHMEDESSIANTVDIDGMKGMETYDKGSKTSSAVLGVHDRYYVAIEVDAELSTLRSIIKSLDLTDLPN